MYVHLHAHRTRDQNRHPRPACGPQKKERKRSEGGRGKTNKEGRKQGRKEKSETYVNECCAAGGDGMDEAELDVAVWGYARDGRGGG